MPDHIDPQTVRRKAHGLIMTVWPQALQGMQETGWEPWVDRWLNVLPTVGRLVGLNLSLPPGNWRESFPQAAMDLVDKMPDDQLANMMATLHGWVNWLADAEPDNPMN